MKLVKNLLSPCKQDKVFKKKMKKASLIFHKDLSKTI